MRVVSGPRWWGLLILMSLVASGIILVAWLTSPADALLHALSDRLPATTAGTVAAPLLSGVLGVGGGLLAARRNGWIDYRLRSLVIIGCVVCTLWLVPVGAFWLVVQGELMALLDGAAGSSAGLSALCTLLLPATGTVLAGAGLVAVQVRSTIRLVALEGHVQTARSQGLPTSALVVRRVLSRLLPAILAVQLVVFVILYAGSLTVQAVFSTPSLAESLPALLPAQGLPLVLGTVLLGVVGLITATVAVATTTSRSALPAPSTAAPDGPLDGALLGVADLAAGVVRPSTSFRSTDLLDIRDLRPGPPVGRTNAEPGDGISLTIPRGQALAVVDDSSDGAALLAHAIIGLFPVGFSAPSGSILFDGTELLGLPEREFRRLRGQRIGFLAAPAADRLAPDVRIGQQLPTLQAGRSGAGRSPAHAGALELLGRVGIQDGQSVLAAYPHQVSAAIAQRVLLAGALVGDPQLLIAHEPTRSLGADEEAGFLDLLHALQQERGFSLLVASTRVEIIARCDRVAIVNEGTIVEHASVRELLTAPQHPHSRRLLAAGAARPLGPASAGF